MTTTTINSTTEDTFTLDTWEVVNCTLAELDGFRDKNGSTTAYVLDGDQLALRGQAKLPV